ncbi:MAG: low affinity iron permease family protein [Alphaproteobacteria bacterium]|nr:low affinity iron permease family protein [Alphaproteobacteria bacterium]
MQQYIANRFEVLSEWISANLGSPHAFMIACAIVALWGISGPIFGFSDTWQLVINTGTTIVTFLMVFLLQNTGNRTIEELQDRLREVEALNREVLAELRALRAESKHRPVLREVA